MHPVTRHVPTFSVALALCACSVSGGSGQLGSLALDLTSQAAGVSYRLSAARFTLEGPEPREFSAPEEVERLELELPQGAYRLTLEEGFTLARSDTADAGPVPAKLVSANPASVTIRPGETTRVALRFELLGGEVTSGQGVLEIGVEVTGPGDGGGVQSGCETGLRIAEVDYEQAGTDDTEFIELLNAGVCPIPLDDLTVELVNGGDGSVYGRYALADVGAPLAVAERLVIGDAEVLGALPADAKRVPLNGAGLQNGPDAVRVLRGTVVLDSVAYEGDVGDTNEGMPTPADDGEHALSRCPDGFDSEDNGRDFRLATPTPGAPNACS